MKKEGLVNSMILMHYDNGHQEAIDWWERMLEDGWHLSISVVTLMERLKRLANLAGNRRTMLSNFESRIEQMRKGSKIRRVYQITPHISEKAFMLPTRLLHTPHTTQQWSFNRRFDLRYANCCYSN